MSWCFCHREQITNVFTPKLSNGTIPKGIVKETKEAKEGKDAAEKQQTCPEETKLLVSATKYVLFFRFLWQIER